MRDTRATLARWNRHPLPVLGAWTLGAALIAAGLLLAVGVIGSIARPDPTPLSIAGVTRAPSLGDVGDVLARNALVLALHAFACVAGFIAGSSLPLEAERHSGAWRWVHDRAGPLAIAFVVGATAFSLLTQAYVIGHAAATISWQLDLSPWVLLATLLPHALPELIALFLPLAAWIIASRRGAWEELLAATFATVALAVPVLVISAFVEVYVSSRLVETVAW